ncbi:helix-turn-helix transcriptional regulator [Pseudooceanicola sp.]
MSEPHDRLKAARSRAGYRTARDAAERLSVAYATYAGHENGSRTFNAEAAQAYAKAFKVTPEWLLYGGLAGLEESAPVAFSEDPGLISVFDIEAQAGVGMVPAAYEAVVDQMAFPPEYLRSITTTPMDKLAIIGVVGASMQPTLNHGDIVMVDMTKTDIDFDGMFVIRIGEALKVKRVNWGPRRQSVVIRSDNANKIQFPDEEYFENDDVNVIGRVVWVGAKQP